MAKVVVQKWEESERGWGTRPDGYSLHLTESDRAWYVQMYWDAQPDAVPDEYSRPCGTPYDATVEDSVVHQLLLAAAEGRHGIRYYSNNYPPPGGKDGWVPLSR